MIFVDVAGSGDQDLSIRWFVYCVTRGCLLKLYRDWQLSGDDEWLRTLLPKARKALAFCWIEGGWDADRDGV